MSNVKKLFVKTNQSETTVSSIWKLIHQFNPIELVLIGVGDDVLNKVRSQLKSKIRVVGVSRNFEIPPSDHYMVVSLR